MFKPRILYYTTNTLNYKHISLPYGLKIIESKQFSDDDYLKYVCLSDTINSINIDAFWYCPHVEIRFTLFKQLVTCDLRFSFDNSIGYMLISYFSDDLRTCYIFNIEDCIKETQIITLDFNKLNDINNAVQVEHY